MRARRTGRAPAAALIALALVLSGCAGVPDSSAPQVVSRLTGGVQSPSPVITPAPDANPRDIVIGFLLNNGTNDARHAAARAFLTPDMAARWVDTPVTVLKAGKVIGGFDSASHTVTLTGLPTGSIDQSGIYTPDLSGQSGTALKIQYKLVEQKGQWRISSLPNGVVIDESTFTSYSPRPIYFYDDATQQDLIADVRHTNLSDTSQIAAWAVQQLIAGPRPDLADAVGTQIPQEIDPRRVSVTLGKTLDISLPGVAAQAPDNLYALAHEVAQTMDGIEGSVPIRLIDGRPLTIPQLNRSSFTLSDFQTESTRPPAAPQVYYLADGQLRTSSGAAVPGPLGNGTYYLNSVAVTQGSGPSNPAVAGVVTANRTQQLWIGTQALGLRRTRLTGKALTRPTWSPNADVVWVGSGSTLYQVASNGAVLPVGLVAAAAGTRIAGTIKAVRFSPDGVRVALVIAQPGGGPSQVWTGAVVQNGSLVSVHGLMPITPENVQMIDVAWNGPRTLFAIGRTGDSDEGNLYEYEVDGVQQADDPISGLPGPPDSLTVSANQPVWVSVTASSTTTVWTQLQNSKWSSPPTASGGDASGTQPVYVEP